jgi:hypothetical protein
MFDHCRGPMNRVRQFQRARGADTRRGFEDLTTDRAVAQCFGREQETTLGLFQLSVAVVLRFDQYLRYRQLTGHCDNFSLG